jgi:hypothetical protein
MSHIEDLRKISGIELIFAIVVASGAVCPGGLIIWNFQPHFIEQFSSVKLIFLSATLTVPCLSFNTLLILFAFGLGDSIKGMADWGLFMVALASCLTAVAFGLPLLVCFFGGFSIRAFAWQGIGLELLLTLLCALLCRSRKKGESKK